VLDRPFQRQKRTYSLERSLYPLSCDAALPMSEPAVTKATFGCFLSRRPPTLLNHVFQHGPRAKKSANYKSIRWADPSESASRLGISKIRTAAILVSALSELENERALEERDDKPEIFV